MLQTSSHNSPCRFQGCSNQRRRRDLDDDGRVEWALWACRVGQQWSQAGVRGKETQFRWNRHSSSTIGSLQKPCPSLPAYIHTLQKVWGSLLTVTTGLTVTATFAMLEIMVEAMLEVETVP